MYILNYIKNNYINVKIKSIFWHTNQFIKKINITYLSNFNLETCNIQQLKY
ncbi:hypothetical protein CAXC1_150024 [Candidatus Xenohaliotis californiensis]|uniref:Uncharacterized protein n=1 Tax=Candidatus Xenohaliotis californiensis TaxID=84677 RepID=A0ABP0ERT0_9RICK|nr:hypothetical protein CAXC1_150024 [Candidatus Xenohaliotis californiensis]